jgi:hypothetical protein
MITSAGRALYDALPSRVTALLEGAHRRGYPYGPTLPDAVPLFCPCFQRAVLKQLLRISPALSLVGATLFSASALLTILPLSFNLCPTLHQIVSPAVRLCRRRPHRPQKTPCVYEQGARRRRLFDAVGDMRIFTVPGVLPRQHRLHLAERRAHC